MNAPSCPWFQRANIAGACHICGATMEQRCAGLPGRTPEALAAESVVQAVRELMERKS